MAETLMSYGLEMHHVIGAGIGHRYDNASMEQILGFVQRHLKKGREAWPQKISFQTRTLRYSRHHWVEILGLRTHWEDTRVDADWNWGNVNLATRNVTALLLRAEPSSGHSVESVMLDGQRFAVPEGKKTYYFQRRAENAACWELLTGLDGQGDSLLRKRPGLQGQSTTRFRERFWSCFPTTIRLRILCVGGWILKRRISSPDGGRCSAGD